MSNNIVTRTGEIQEGNDLSLRSPNQYKNYLERALTGHGWNFTETDSGNGGYLKYRLTHEDGTVKDIHVYLKPVVWRNRHEDEKAAQMSASMDMRGFDAAERGELLYVFGIYRDPTSSGDPNSQEDEYVICSWMPTEWGANRGRAAYNYFIRTDLISEAFKIGFSSAIERDRSVYCFRPESLYYYITNQAKLHQVVTDLDEVSTQNSVNFKDEFIDWFIDRDGNEHNYFSTQFASSKTRLIQELEKTEEIYEKEFDSKIFSTDDGDIKSLIKSLENNLSKNEGEFYDYSSAKSNHRPRAIIGKNNYIKFLNELLNQKASTKTIKIYEEQIKFDISSFQNACKSAGLIYSDTLVTRFVSSLLTKPFVILTGLSGSGKTKLAQAYVQWICQEESQYRIIPVGADWTNREPLLGYPNGLDETKYVSPDSGALNLILEAYTNKDLPYFLILDEMNLSHVERYFADFLSIMESQDSIKLYSGGGRTDNNDIPIKKEIEWPENLFIIGTVNIDETTYMFSPKVLDRANVIEFRISEKDMEKFLTEKNQLEMEKLFFDKKKENGGLGQSMSIDFMKKALDNNKNHGINITKLKDFFVELQEVGAEFGYRSASEIEMLLTKLDNNISQDNDKLDIAIMQKLLPKLHGSRKKLVKPLDKLASLCIEPKEKIKDADKEKSNFELYLIDKARNKGEEKWNIIHPISFEKIERMYKNLLENGFVSYAEA